jgi:hypothetical protein
MDKVQKPSINECYTPSSEPYRVYKPPFRTEIKCSSAAEIFPVERLKVMEIIRHDIVVSKPAVIRGLPQALQAHCGAVPCYRGDNLPSLLFLLILSLNTI